MNHHDYDPEGTGKISEHAAAAQKGRVYLSAHKLTEEWAAGTLAADRIFDYLERNLDAIRFRAMDIESLQHVAECCHALVEWSHGQRTLGDFLIAVVENKLTEAVYMADETNRRALWLYPAFIREVAPVGWNKPPRGWAKLHPRGLARTIGDHECVPVTTPDGHGSYCRICGETLS